MTNEELERAVERLTRAIVRASGAALVDYDDLRALLSERAELLAAVERMRGAIVFATTTLYPEALFRIADTLGRAGVTKEAGEGLRMMGHNEQIVADRLRAALTTGEEK